MPYTSKINSSRSAFVGNPALRIPFRPEMSAVLGCRAIQSYTALYPVGLEFLRCKENLFLASPSYSLSRTNSGPLPPPRASYLHSIRNTSEQAPARYLLLAPFREGPSPEQREQGGAGPRSAVAPPLSRPDPLSLPPPPQPPRRESGGTRRADRKSVV